MKNGEESSRNHSWKRLGSASAWIFFTETIFLTNFKKILNIRRAERNYSGKRGRWLPPSSPRRAGLLPPEGTAFFWNPQEGPSGPGCYLHTPFCFFCLFILRNVTELYGLRNDTYFLSGMSRNLTDYATMPFFTFGMLRNFTDCAIMLPFDFRHAAKLHGLPNDGC